MGRCRILVVEDDPLLSLHLEAIITQAIDADIFISASVAEARRFIDDPFDYAFLDVDVIDGTTYALATDLSRRSIPFAFLSASDREQVPPALRAAPFVAKPYTPQDIRGLLQGAGRG